MKALVPDLAMVPRLLIKSALVIPIPVSTMVRVQSCLLKIRLMCNFFPESSFPGSVRLLYQMILSRASDELEMSSLRKISMFE